MMVPVFISFLLFAYRPYINRKSAIAIPKLSMVIPLSIKIIIPINPIGINPMINPIFFNFFLAKKNPNKNRASPTAKRMVNKKINPYKIRAPILFV